MTQASTKHDSTRLENFTCILSVLGKEADFFYLTVDTTYKMPRRIIDNI
jgi:hypothetical protein